MNAKTMMTTAALSMLATAAHAITSEEIAAALDVDPSVATFTTSGDAEWYVDTSTATNGSSCMRSGNLPADYVWKYSNMSMPVEVRRVSRLIVWVKTSCHTSTDRAYLQIQDGQATYNYNGIYDWRKVEIILLPGQHNIVFSFRRYCYSNGSNCVWVDNPTITPLYEDAATVTVDNIKCTQRTPWNGKVDIDYTVSCSKENADIWVYPVGYDKDTNKTMAPRALEGDGVNAPVKAGTHRMTWTVTDDYPNFNSTAFTVKMTALIGAAPYMVVDLSGGVDAMTYPVEYLSSVPEGGWGDEYKTKKLVLRLIPSGCFQMGSPSDETGRGGYEDSHGVVLSKPFYIGVFECTQKQYQLVMGSTPSNYKGDTRPVEMVSYGNVRGTVNGLGWPSHNQVDANSFMGRLRSKVNMLFDLPTEAQWEYACRAGSSSALNDGTQYSESNLKKLARCSFNTGDGKGGYSQHTKVGCYLDNAWGLYDMHGNVREWCVDNSNYAGLGYWGCVDPKGATTCYQYYGDGRYCVRVVRGGCWWDNSGCRSAWRDVQDSRMSVGSTYNYVGFRVYCSPVAQ